MQTIETDGAPPAMVPGREHRRRTLLKGQVRYGGSLTVDVLVRDLTLGGRS